MTYNVVVCDDNEADIRYITLLVNEWAVRRLVHVRIKSFPSAESFLFHCADDPNHQILLLDVEMGNMDEITLAKRVRASNADIQIVFITGYPDYIAEGYEVSALGQGSDPEVVDGVKSSYRIAGDSDKDQDDAARDAVRSRALLLMSCFRTAG